MSLSIALSGVQAAQTDIDTIGNNIANVSTVGFKQANAEFSDVFSALLARFEWNEAAMRAAIEPAMYATDMAIEAAVAGVPFRDAYRQAAQHADAPGAPRSPEASLAARVSPGAAGDLRLDELRARLDAFEDERKE